MYRGQGLLDISFLTTVSDDLLRASADKTLWIHRFVDFFPNRLENLCFVDSLNEVVLTVHLLDHLTGVVTQDADLFVVIAERHELHYDIFRSP